MGQQLICSLFLISFFTVQCFEDPFEMKINILKGQSK